MLAEATSTEIPAFTTDTPEPVTATVGAALTQAANAELTNIPTSTALPKTGIGDEFGAPGLVIAGMMLIAVIFLARRLPRHAEINRSSAPPKVRRRSPPHL